MAWTDPDKATAKEMWEGGKESSSTIAKWFGTTRSAICALANRNGWVSPNSPGSNQNERKRKKLPTTIRTDKKNTERLIAVEEQTNPELAEYDAAIPVEQRKNIRNLKEDSCRWIVGEPRDPGHFYCGAVQDGGYYPYCAFHHRAAVQPLTLRVGDFALAKWKTTVRSGW